MADDKGGAGTAAAAPAARRPGFTADVGIEVGNGRNQRFYVSVFTQDILRGFWKRGNLHQDEMVPPVSEFEYIPGVRILVSGRRRILRVIDPLGLPEFKGLLDEMQEKLRGVCGGIPVPVEPVEVKDATDTRIKSWLYWMRRLLDGSPVQRNPRTKKYLSGGTEAVVLDDSAPFPTMDEIAALPGKTRRDLNATNKMSVRYLEDLPPEDRRQADED
jgi:hypothetical protein